MVVFYHFDMEINVVADATTGDFILIDIDVIVELAATLLIERLVTFGSIDWVTCENLLILDLAELSILEGLTHQYGQKFLLFSL